MLVELVRLGVHRGALRWSPSSAPLTGGEPDDVARALAGLAAEGAPAEPGRTLHSTSWRYDDGAVVLTYAVFPDPGAHAGWEPLGEHLAVCAGPVSPGPPHVDGSQVAAHAARHLAYLAAGRDPHLTRCARQDPGPWALLAERAAEVHAHVPVAVP